MKWELSPNVCRICGARAGDPCYWVDRSTRPPTVLPIQRLTTHGEREEVSDA